MDDAPTGCAVVKFRKRPISFNRYVNWSPRVVEFDWSPRPPHHVVYSKLPLNNGWASQGQPASSVQGGMRQKRNNRRCWSSLIACVLTAKRSIYVFDDVSKCNAECSNKSVLRVTRHRSEVRLAMYERVQFKKYEQPKRTYALSCWRTGGRLKERLPTDSGWDNPFRPDGDLSREADEIVELIKGGKPITPTPGSVAPKLPFVSEAADSAPSSPTALTAPTIQQSPPQRKVLGANGAAPCTEEKQPLNSAPAPVEVKRETVVPASDASQVEHVVLKKKPKCKCCVIQTGEPPSHSTPHPLPITMSRGTIARLRISVEQLYHCYLTTYLRGATLPLLSDYISPWSNSTIAIRLHISVEQLYHCYQTKFLRGATYYCYLTTYIRGATLKLLSDYIYPWSHSKIAI
uniref:Uncharacterized protein n=1 Tax=Timema tahoe TaxID=61484 RepID=A0A7R9FMF2_9NEOP|nr:unnamed protein product [Timema tahoe]